MPESTAFFCSILNALPEQIVVIDEYGLIHYVNDNWCQFACSNGYQPKLDWRAINYLEECDKAAYHGDNFGLDAGNGIRQIINKTKDTFYLEYPCHSPTEKRWFMMRVSPLDITGESFFAISHNNITERKLAEEKVEQLSRLDGLTNIPNRRSFDEFLHSEWRRCTRLKMPITLAMIDIDYFKQLNDDYGHPFGDLCLMKIAGVLQDYARRPSDICARYGGEEFAIVLGNTELESAYGIIAKALDAIHHLSVPLPNANKKIDKANITVSIGLATYHPNGHNAEESLISSADELLYQAKHSGRDRIISKSL